MKVTSVRPNNCCCDRIGIIEWMENTCTLKDFLSNTLTEEEKGRASR